MKNTKKLELQLKILSLKAAILGLMIRLFGLRKKKKVLSRDEIGNIIMDIAIKEGVSPMLAYKVAKCESNLNPNAKNWCGKYGWDRGLYQWNEYWHPEVSDTCAYDVKCSTRAFCKAVKAGHLSWWNPSKKCWKSALA